MKLSVNGVNSHIQMPRCVLKRFENEHHSFYYYDVEKGIIGSNGHAKTINTQFGYYSKAVERNLNDNIEAPFSTLLQFIDSIDFDGPVFRVNDNFSTNVKSFIYALIARDPKLQSEIGKNSVYYKFLPTQAQHDWAAIEGIRLAHKEGFFDSYFVTFTINKTKKPFVLPMCGISSYKFADIVHVNLPISPLVAITLVEAKGADELVNDGTAKIYLVNSDNIIDYFNGCAFRTQCNTGCGYVVSSQKIVLKELAVKNRKDREG